MESSKSWSVPSAMKRFTGTDRREGLRPLWAVCEDGNRTRSGWGVERRGGLEIPDWKNSIYQLLGGKAEHMTDMQV